VVFGEKQIDVNIRLTANGKLSLLSDFLIGILTKSENK